MSDTVDRRTESETVVEKCQNGRRGPGMREGVVGFVTNRHGRANRICRIKETEDHNNSQTPLCTLFVVVSGLSAGEEQFATLELTAAAEGAVGRTVQWGS